MSDKIREKHEFLKSIGHIKNVFTVGEGVEITVVGLDGEPTVLQGTVDDISAEGSVVWVLITDDDGRCDTYTVDEKLVTKRRDLLAETEHTEVGSW